MRVLSLTVVRMIPVAIALVGTRPRVQTTAYVGWFGPRGLASIVFIVITLEGTTPHPFGRDRVRGRRDDHPVGPTRTGSPRAR